MINQRGIYGVEKPGADLTDGGAEHAEYRKGDDEADDRVSVVPAARDRSRSEEDGKAGETVGAGVEAVGDERDAADHALKFRVAKEICRRVGEHGRSVTQVAREFGIGRSAALEAARRHDTPLVEDPSRSML